MSRKRNVKWTGPTARIPVRVFLQTEDYERLRRRVYEEHSTFQDEVEAAILDRLDLGPEDIRPLPAEEEQVERGEFGRAATEAAKRLGMLQSDIARKSGVSATTVWNILSGNVEGRPNTRAAIAKVLGIEAPPLPSKRQHKGETDQ